MSTEPTPFALKVWQFVNSNADGLALIFSLIAVAISLGALRQARSLRQSDIALESNKTRISAQEKLGEIMGEPERLKAEWKATFAARGMLNSGAMITMEKDLDAISSELTELQSKISAFKQLTQRSSRKELDETVSDLHLLATRVDLAAEKLAVNQERLDQNRRDLMRQTRR